MKSQHDFPSLNSKNPDGIKSNGNPYRIIVIDDQDFHRKQLVQIIESEGYEVVAEATNGQEGLYQYDLHKNEVDLIVTDLDMPVLDGYAMLYELNNRKEQVKVMFVSEETTKGVLQDLLKLGAVDFLLKPIQRKQVLERLKLVFQK